MIGQRVCTAAPSVTGTNGEGLERPEKQRRKTVFWVVLFLIKFWRGAFF